jgi:hypothetical protein
MMEITLDKMVPGTIYYCVQGGLSDVFSVKKFFTTDREAELFLENAIREYSKDYRPGATYSESGTSVRAFICKHRAMVE